MGYFFLVVLAFFLVAFFAVAIVSITSSLAVRGGMGRPYLRFFDGFDSRCVSALPAADFEGLSCLLLARTLPAFDAAYLPVCSLGILSTPWMVA
jgi:hypothetical protein